MLSHIVTDVSNILKPPSYDKVLLQGTQTLVGISGKLKADGNEAPHVVHTKAKGKQDNVE